MKKVYLILFILLQLVPGFILAADSVYYKKTNLIDTRVIPPNSIGVLLNNHIPENSYQLIFRDKNEEQDAYIIADTGMPAFELIDLTTNSIVEHAITRIRNAGYRDRILKLEDDSKAAWKFQVKKDNPKKNGGKQETPKDFIFLPTNNKIESCILLDYEIEAYKRDCSSKKRSEILTKKSNEDPNFHKDYKPFEYIDKKLDESVSSECASESEKEFSSIIEEPFCKEVQAHLKNLIKRKPSMKSNIIWKEGYREELNIMIDKGFIRPIIEEESIYFNGPIRIEPIGGFIPGHEYELIKTEHGSRVKKWLIKVGKDKLNPELLKKIKIEKLGEFEKHQLHQWFYSHHGRLIHSGLFQRFKITFPSQLNEYRDFLNFHTLYRCKPDKDNNSFKYFIGNSRTVSTFKNEYSYLDLEPLERECYNLNSEKNSLQVLLATGSLEFDDTFVKSNAIDLAFKNGVSNAKEGSLTHLLEQGWFASSLSKIYRNHTPEEILSELLIVSSFGGGKREYESFYSSKFSEILNFLNEKEPVFFQQNMFEMLKTIDKFSGNYTFKNALMNDVLYIGGKNCREKKYDNKNSENNKFNIRYDDLFLLLNLSNKNRVSDSDILRFMTLNLNECGIDPDIEVNEIINVLKNSHEKERTLIRPFLPDPLKNIDENNLLLKLKGDPDSIKSFCDLEMNYRLFNRKMNKSPAPPQKSQKYDIVKDSRISEALSEAIMNDETFKATEYSSGAGNCLLLIAEKAFMQKNHDLCNAFESRYLTLVDLPENQLSDWYLNGNEKNINDSFYFKSMRNKRQHSLIKLKEDIADYYYFFLKRYCDTPIKRVSFTKKIIANYVVPPDFNDFTKVSFQPDPSTNNILDEKNQIPEIAYYHFLYFTLKSHFEMSNQLHGFSMNKTELQFYHQTRETHDTPYVIEYNFDIRDEKETDIRFTLMKTESREVIESIKISFPYAFTGVLNESTIPEKLLTELSDWVIESIK